MPARACASAGDFTRKTRPFAFDAVPNPTSSSKLHASSSSDTDRDEDEDAADMKSSCGCDRRDEEEAVDESELRGFPVLCCPSITASLVQSEPPAAASFESFDPPPPPRLSFFFFFFSFLSLSYLSGDLTTSALLPLLACPLPPPIPAPPTEARRRWLSWICRASSSGCRPIVGVGRAKSIA